MLTSTVYTRLSTLHHCPHSCFLHQLAFYKILIKYMC